MLDDNSNATIWDEIHGYTWIYSVINCITDCCTNPLCQYMYAMWTFGHWWVTWFVAKVSKLWGRTRLRKLSALCTWNEMALPLGAHSISPRHRTGSMHKIFPDGWFFMGTVKGGGDCFSVHWSFWKCRVLMVMNPIRQSGVRIGNSYLKEVSWIAEFAVQGVLHIF